MIDDKPFVRLMLLIGQVLETCDYTVDAGVTGAMTIRFSRNRGAVRGEKPAITIIFVGDVAQQGDTGLTQDEILRVLTVDLQIDVDLATEISGLDPTGLGLLGRIVDVSMGALRAEGGTMSLWCDWIVPTDVEPEDRSTPDQGRLVQALDVIYRVHARDENVLLAAGENA